MRRFAIAVLLLAGCGGDDAVVTPDAAPEIDAAVGIDGPLACEQPDLCAPAVPDGWDGYVLVYDGDLGAAPDCPPQYTTESFPGDRDLTAPAATCTACTCGADAGGACPSSGGTPTLPAVTWGGSGKVCTGALPDSDCEDGLCWRGPTTGFVAGLCISHDGDLACPAGDFADRHVFFDDVDDTRGCDACTCGAPSGGFCAPSGGVAHGDVTPIAATTFCCAT